jgi:multicomponent K+:H+ antiporter subunit E
MNNTHHSAPPRQAGAHLKAEKAKAGWLDYPVLSAVLALSWLLLQHSLAVVHILSAIGLGLLIPRLLARFLPKQPAIRYTAALRLFCIVLYDIVLSNIQVAKIVLGRVDQAKPAWIEVPLTVHNPLAIHLFASIITTTPGTVSAVVDEEGRCIWVHALNCDNPLTAAQDMKNRYEQPLRLIFGEENRA